MSTTKAPSIFGTIKAFFTTTVPKAGNVVNEAFVALDVNMNSLTNLSIVGNLETKILAVEAIGDYNKSLEEASTEDNKVTAESVDNLIAKYRR